VSPEAALAFVEKHGAVLVSAKGPIPRLTEAIAGGPIKGSWWSHPKGRKIFAVLQTVCDSPDVLVCRLIDGHITLLHRRLWAATVKMADQFQPAQLAQVRQEHTATGRHVNQITAYPEWVPRQIFKDAKAMSATDATKLMGDLIALASPRLAAK
jgi:hypothetical protein